MFGLRQVNRHVVLFQRGIIISIGSLKQLLMCMKTDFNIK